MVIKPLPFGAHPVTEERVAAVEQQLRMRFPEQYRRFLLTYNGGETEPNTFDVPAQDDTDVLNEFYGIDVHPDADLVKTALIFHRRIPSSYLPIGDDPFGNMICIGVKGPHTGQIFFWDHELEPTTQQNLFYLAPSFDAFLELLYEDDEEEDEDEDDEE